MGDYEETKKELRSIRNANWCAILVEIIISVSIFVVIKKPCTEFIYIVMKWWSISFWVSCILSNIILIVKANKAIQSPEILINIKWQHSSFRLYQRVLYIQISVMILVFLVDLIAYILTLYPVSTCYGDDEHDTWVNEFLWYTIRVI